MTRKTSHMQDAEPFLEGVLSQVRFLQANRYIKEGDVIADLGCGFHGNFLVSVARKIKSGVGYDISVSKKNTPRNIFLRKANLNGNFADKKNYYDKVFALAVLEHIENPTNFLKQIKTMLKKGGMMIITTPHKKAKRILEFLSLRLGLISKEEILDHKNYFEEKTLKSTLKKSDLKVVRIGTFEMGWNLICVAKKA